LRDRTSKLPSIGSKSAAVVLAPSIVFWLLLPGIVFPLRSIRKAQEEAELRYVSTNATIAKMFEHELTESKHLKNEFDSLLRKISERNKNKEIYDRLVSSRKETDEESDQCDVSLAGSDRITQSSPPAKSEHPLQEELHGLTVKTERLLTETRNTEHALQQEPQYTAEWAAYSAERSSEHENTENGNSSWNYLIMLLQWLGLWGHPSTARQKPTIPRRQLDLPKFVPHPG
jgi:hypothetical protein